ncbi:MAG: DNA repair protein RecN [Corallococcus sp.]|nr:DNA repair protein RecN [Corallococcus sp.]MCM1359699.1 DNA repair protein RecN [Corallococcus sp.]MCM1395408.1 DNA repair protein RecN [Corallococcus sp.]
MIKSIEINNIALIDRLEIEFTNGLTVLSGETGSGKSIIIDSLAFVLGDRADKTMIKYGEDWADVTALFEVDENCPVLKKLEEYGYGSDTEILLSRKMTVSGKNEIRIQGKQATLAILKEVAAELVDIFGQGQHLALLNEKNQLAVLDSFCNFNGADLRLKNELAPRLASINRQLKSFGGSDAERERLLDILKYQIEELANADLSEEEEAELLATHKRMMNLEKITVALSQATECLSGENGAISQLSLAQNNLGTISAYEQSADELGKRLDSSRLEAQDVCDTLENILSSMDFSPAEQEKAEARLEQIKSIKRKYGGTVKDALAFLTEAETKYQTLSHSSEAIAALNEEKRQVLAEMYSLAECKSTERRRAAKVLADRIMKELADLGMRGTQFEVDFNEKPGLDEYGESPSSDGFDKAVFLMSANVGEPLKPLSKVISGGEMSRFMLAVKNITALAEKIPTMVFDEIDTGISGNMAQMVAVKLANVSSRSQDGFQCIVITHLPQIMAMSDAALYIEKKEYDGRTHTLVTPLCGEEARAKEVARLMGSVGEHAIVSAKELLDWSNDYKRTLN